MHFVLLLVLTCSLQSGTFCPVMCTCPSAVEMDCTNKDLEIIPTPPNPHKIEILKFSRNSLREITALTFKPFPNLRELNLDGNIIDSVQKNAFDPLANLELVSLRSNVIEDLDEDVFTKTVNLRMIDLSWNQLKSIQFSLHNLTNLVELHLSHNQLTSINENTLSGARNLNKISLDGNEISQMHILAFSHSYFWTYLILSDNQLEHVHLQLMGGQIFTQLYLDLQNCRLKTFPRVESGTLSILMLSNNLIESIRAQDLDNLRSSLLYIDLSRNKLKEIEDSAFAAFTELVNLEMADNSLVQVPRHLPQSLKELNIRNNSITRIDGNCFRGLALLKKLDLCGNRISELSSYVFNGLDSLEELDISHNRIRILDLAALTGSLTSLTISHNKGDNISVFSTDSRRTNLSTLDLTGSVGLCQPLLTFVDRIMSPNPLTLHIDSCGLTGIGMTHILALGPVQHIKLCGNPWKCSESQWIVPFLDKYPMYDKHPTDGKHPMDDKQCFHCRTSAGIYLSPQDLRNPSASTRNMSTESTTVEQRNISKLVVIPSGQTGTFYKPKDILVIIAVISALILLFVVIVVAFNHVLKVRENRTLPGNSYIRADSLVFSPLKDEIFYGASKDPLVKTLERLPARSAADMEQFNAWIGTF